MKIEIHSGVNLLIESSGSYKTVFFDKPVRTMELTQEEALQIASLLTCGFKSGPTAKEKKLFTKKIITICGSMKFLEEMRTIRQVLEKKGHVVKTPPLIDPSILKENCRDQQDFLHIKSQMMRSHMENIKSSDAVLILNCSKDMAQNYIGVNTLLEIGIAFDNHVPIFLLNEAPKDIEEIWAMNPNVLGGLENLEKSNDI